MSGAFHVKQSGLDLDFHLIEPHRTAWHLRIADMQLVSRTRF